jgi:peptide/nickel transport system ATP-binding protein
MVTDVALLSVENLVTHYRTQRGFVKAVDGVSFEVKEKEAMGLAGESGCGKTTIALSVLKILPGEAQIKSGHVFFRDTDIVQLSDREVREKIRWKKISLVFQGAMNAMNPVYKIGDQIAEAVMTHEPNVKKEEAVERGKKLFELVGVEPSRIGNYPHEFSGGMRQRAMLAMALATNPELLIADEPATALDVIVQAQLLKLIKSLKENLGLSLILITHDLSIITEICDSVAIMYAGKIAEKGSVVSVYKNPLHPYTQGLIGAFPSIYAAKTRMTSIPGFPPDLLRPPTGCKFHPRCKFAMDVCKKVEPSLLVAEKNHLVACHLVKSSEES